MDEVLPIKLSRHFHDRLKERHHGMVLTPEERLEVAATITAVVDAQPWIAGEESVELVCRMADGRKFTCVYVPWRRAVVTSITNGKMGKHKFKKKVLPTLNTWTGETKEARAERMEVGKRIALRKQQRPREAQHHRRRLNQMLLEIQQGEDEGVLFE